MFIILCCNYIHTVQHKDSNRNTVTSSSQCEAPPLSLQAYQRILTCTLHTTQETFDIPLTVSTTAISYLLFNWGAFWQPAFDSHICLNTRLILTFIFYQSAFISDIEQSITHWLNFDISSVKHREDCDSKI